MNPVRDTSIPSENAAFGFGEHLRWDLNRRQPALGQLWMTDARRCHPSRRSIVVDAIPGGPRPSPRIATAPSPLHRERRPAVAAPVEHHKAKFLVGERALRLPLLGTGRQRAVHEHDAFPGAPLLDMQAAPAIGCCTRASARSASIVISVPFHRVARAATMLARRVFHPHAVRKGAVPGGARLSPSTRWSNRLSRLGTWVRLNLTNEPPFERFCNVPRFDCRRFTVLRRRCCPVQA